MKPLLGIVPAGVAAALVMLASEPARAQASPDTSDLQLGEPGLPARSRAFELTVGTGYTQGFGMLQPGVGMPQVANAGIGVEGTLGYRVDRNFGVSIGTQYQELQPERNDAARAFAFGLALQYHVVPDARLDPWVEVGSGYRVLLLEPELFGPTTVFHGPQLVRVRAGLDVRLSREVAIAPVIGADATMFVIRDDVNITAIADPTISTFVFAGLQGRLDLGGI